MLTLETTTDVCSLLADQDCWNGLARGVPFRETSWLASWWQHFGQGREAYVVTARDQTGQLRGMLPLYRQANSAGHGRTLAMLGDGQACSDHASVLAHEPDVCQVAFQIGQHLASSAGDTRWGWDLLDLDGIVEGDPGATELARGLRAGGSELHASSRMSVWYKPADANWDEHLKHYGKTQRRKMRRWSEKIGPAAPFQQRSAQTHQQARQWIDVLIEMHQQRWNEVGEAGSFASPQFQEFIHDAARSFLDRQRLYVTVLEEQDRIIAAELSFLGENGVLYVYSAGFDTSKADLEPGRILSVDTLQHLYRSKLTGIDYMRGDETYKQRYATESRRLIRLRAVAPTLLPRIRHAAWCTGFELKQWMRRQTGRQPIVVLDPTATPTITPPIPQP